MTAENISFHGREDKSDFLLPLRKDVNAIGTLFPLIILLWNMHRRGYSGVKMLLSLGCLTTFCCEKKEKKTAFKPRNYYCYKCNVTIIVMGKKDDFLFKLANASEQLYIFHKHSLKKLIQTCCSSFYILKIWNCHF